MSLRVKSLHIYPIKSCGGIAVETAEVKRSGLEGDRVYMLIDEDASFVTGRTEPRLVLVKLTRLERAFLAEAEGAKPLQLPIDPGAEHGALLNGGARIWKDEVTVQMHQEGSLWFSQYLARSVSLVFLDPASPRAVSQEFGRAGDVVSLADGFPLLLTGQSSLDDLNARLDEPVSMSRFRPNVVFSGGSSYEEDTWSRLSIGESRFRAPKLCSRCVFTTIDEVSATKGKEPLKTLSRYRRWGRAVWFGSNLIAASEGQLNVGDEVKVFERRAHPRDSE